MSEEVGYIVGDKGPGEINNYVTRDLGWQRMGRDYWRDDEERLIKYVSETSVLRKAASGTRVYFPDCTSVSMHQAVEAVCHMYDLELRLV